MNTKCVCLAGLALALLLGAETASASSMRCGVHIIQDGGRHGPRQYEVLKKCGEPTHRQGDTWIYERRGQPTRILRFGGNGILSTIQERR